MNAIKLSILSLFLLLSFTACEKKDPTQLHKVHWDRDMCERCKMVVSDRKHTVQVINVETRHSYMFDDIGCLSLWIEDEKIEWMPTAKVWITDATTGEWIDAKKAFYDKGYITPMAYGFSAHHTKATLKDGTTYQTYEQIMKIILKIEAQKNRKSY